MALTLKTIIENAKEVEVLEETKTTTTTIKEAQVDQQLAFLEKQLTALQSRKEELLAKKALFK